MYVTDRGSKTGAQYPNWPGLGSCNGQQGSAVMLYTHQRYARERVRVRERPGFASTAAYFERLAQKEVRDYDRRQRLLEMAHFYRSLAGIIPGMPDGYKVGEGVAGCYTCAALARTCRGVPNACRLLHRSDLSRTIERTCAGV